MYGGGGVKTIEVSFRDGPWPCVCVIVLWYWLLCDVTQADSHGALGSSDVVILLHGFPTSSYDWNKVGFAAFFWTLVTTSCGQTCLFVFLLTDMGTAHTALPSSHCAGLPGVWFQRQASEWTMQVEMCPTESTHRCTCSVLLSGLTDTPSLSRPTWWKPWWLTWVWSTNGSMWFLTITETLWRWSCCTGAWSFWLLEMIRTC